MSSNTRSVQLNSRAGLLDVLAAHSQLPLQVLLPPLLLRGLVVHSAKFMVLVEVSRHYQLVCLYNFHSSSSPSSSPCPAPDFSL